MAVDIQILDNVKIKYNFDFVKKVKILLNVVPIEHLKGLNKIIIRNDSPDKKYSNASGLYYPQNHDGPAYIVLCIDNICLGHSTLFLKVAPFFLNSFLADVLYHEIGHHYQRITHGKKKEVWEADAEKYSINMKNNYYSSVGIGKLLSSFTKKPK